MSLVAESPAAEAAAATTPAVAMRVQGLGKRYLLEGARGAGALLQARLKEKQTFWALRGVSFEVAAGERVGIIGRNGAGKSTLLKILSRVIAPSEGRAEIRGRVASLLEVGTGFNPRLSGRDNIFLNAALLGLSRKETEARLADIITFAELGRFIEEPIKTYSTGMRARLGFAIAAHIDPDVLMLDEVLSVGDAAFQAKCLQRVGEMVGTANPTLLFVSHSVAAVRRFCDRCLWLDKAELVMDGDVVTVTEAYEEQLLKVKGEYRAPPRIPPAAAPPLVPSKTEQPEEVAHVVAATVRNTAGEQTNSVRIDESILIEVVFDVYKSGRRIEPALHFFNERGDVIFVAAFTDPDCPHAINECGRHRAVAHVPGNLLNDGVHRLSVVLVTADPLVRHETLEKVLSFSVFERAGARFDQVARGRYARQFPGAVRPKLSWTHARVS
jgi:lipopolysaccharide transport system ATP-binding protein